MARKGSMNDMAEVKRSEVRRVLRSDQVKTMVLK